MSDGPDPSGAPPPGDVTQLLQAHAQGDAASDDRLLRLVYGELRRLARQHRAGWSGQETLSTTDLVHESYLRLVGANGDYASRAHFLGVASKAMRHVLVDHARRKSAAKRGGPEPDLPLRETLVGGVPSEPEEVLALHEALERLEATAPRQACIVECRFFGGLTHEETAAVLGVSEVTVRRGWRLAKAWLYRELGGA